MIERFIRTLKEECIYLHDFESLGDARTVIGGFIERHGHKTPAEVREQITRMAA